MIPNLHGDGRLCVTQSRPSTFFDRTEVPNVFFSTVVSPDRIVTEPRTRKLFGPNNPPKHAITNDDPSDPNHPLGMKNTLPSLLVPPTRHTRCTAGLHPHLAAAIPDPRVFMAVLYSLAAITPDTEFGLSFYDYFTEEERFALWRVASLREYLPKMNSAPSRGLSIDMAKPLMRQLLGSAQEAVDGGEVCAALRFGHGEDTMPPSVILEVADPYYDREDSAPIAATKSPYAGHEAPAQSGDRLLIPETARTHGSRRSSYDGSRAFSATG